MLGKTNIMPVAKNINLKIHYHPTTPPTDTESLWVKSASAPDKVIVDNDVSGTYSAELLDTTIPYAAKYCSAKVGRYIYLFSDDSNVFANNFKYNIDTGVFSPLANNSRTTPIVSSFQLCAAVGTKIYLFSPRQQQILDYYDTADDTWGYVDLSINLTSYDRFNLRRYSVSVIGTDIYILGCAVSQGWGLYRYDAIFKYDTLTNTLTFLNYGASIGTDNCSTTFRSYAYNGLIYYIFSAFNNTNRANNISVYDPTTNVVTNKIVFGKDPNNDNSIGQYSCVGGIGDKIFIIGGNKVVYNTTATERNRELYIYDITQNKILNSWIEDGYGCFSPVATLPYGVSDNPITYDGVDAYIFGGNMYNENLSQMPNNKVIKFSISAPLQNNTMKIVQNNLTTNHADLIEEDNLSLPIYPFDVFIGDANNLAQAVEACVYDTAASSWVSVNEARVALFPQNYIWWDNLDFGLDEPTDLTHYWIKCNNPTRISYVISTPSSLNVNELAIKLNTIGSTKIFEGQKTRIKAVCGRAFLGNAVGIPVAYDIYHYNFVTSEWVVGEVQPVGNIVLDHTVTFKIGNEIYQIIGVNDGDSISKPQDKTIGTSIYKRWKDTDNNTITFPYTPTADIVLNGQEEPYI